MQYIRLSKLRVEKKLSQKDVGEKVGVKQRAYANYESGQRPLPVRVLCALADLYGVSTDYLLGRTDIKDPYPKK